MFFRDCAVDAVEDLFAHFSYLGLAKDNKDMATKLGIDDKVETTARKDAFITLKDHKPNFANKPTCRLINPTKLN